MFYLFNRWLFVEIESKEGRKTETRHKTVSTNDGLPEISKMKYRIPEPGTTISGFVDSYKKKKKKKLMPTDRRFF